MNTVRNAKEISCFRILLWLAFGLSAIWALVTSIRLNRIFQDAWILDDIWFPSLILFITFVLIIYFEGNLSPLTIFSSAFAFLLTALPALKYHFIYGSAVDQAAHYDLIRSIVQTGQVYSGSSYAATPGFQSLVASLSSLPEGSLVLWSKLLPAFLGALIPLGFYMLCHRSSVPESLARVIIVLSAFSLPLLYRLNGTSFTVPLVVCLVILFFLRLLSHPDSGHRLSYTLLILILLLAIIFWHPASTLVLSFIFIVAGLLFAHWPAKEDPFLRQASSLASLGLICIIAAFTYWMYSADFVWLKFVDNIRLALQADLTPDPIPNRIYQIPFVDRFIVFSFFHARDAVFIALSVVGILPLFTSQSQEILDKFLRTYAVLWLVFMGLLAVILISDFGAQGYRRFLHYLVAISTPLAGYGLWRISLLLSKFFPGRSNLIPAASGLVVVLAIAFFQQYPYQPGMPNFKNEDTAGSDTPLLYMHQVNTLHQYLMLDYGLNRLSTKAQLVTDYIGSRQALLFFGHQARDRSRRTTTQRPEPAFLLLHHPGKAGAYAEQAEYRSSHVIKSWIDISNMSKVYENGGSFVLYHPENAQNSFKLEADQ